MTRVTHPAFRVVGGTRGGRGGPGVGVGYDNRMLILVDEAITGATELLQEFGHVRTFAGRLLAPVDTSDADVLIVRSVTRVDAKLLTGSHVRFVGTATSGIDHVDTAWLKKNSIAFAAAAGCNARTVAEYVLGSILHVAERYGFDPRDKTLGVIGVGHVGSRVADWGRALGMQVLLCDPPLRRQSGGTQFVGFSELASRADIVTLHVSLTRSGDDATWGMVNRSWLSTLKTGAMLINTSRGQVVCEGDLLAAIDSGSLGAVVLDVWRNEPDVDRGLVDRVEIATPHVAGYSVEAKQRGVRMIRDALADFVRAQRCSCDRGLGRETRSVERAGGGGIDGAVTPRTKGWYLAAGEVIRQACDIAVMDEAFRKALRRSDSAKGFDRLREASASRREFTSHRVKSPSIRGEVGGLLSHIGFQIVA